MGVKLIRKPVAGGLPLIHANGHDHKEFLRVLPPFAARIKATRLHVGPRTAAWLAQLVATDQLQMPATLEVEVSPLVEDETTGVLLNSLDTPPKVVGYVCGLCPPPPDPSEN